MARHIAVLDIGGSKVVCLICAMSGGALAVHGAGVCEYAGYKAGDYSPYELPGKKDLTVAVRRAVSQAGHEAGLSVKSVVMGVGAPFLKTALILGELFSEKKAHLTIEPDEDRLIDVSLKDTDIDGYDRIHSTPVAFYADDAESATLPVGVEAYRLQCQVAHAYIEREFKSLALDALLSLGITVDTLIGVPLAEAMFLIPESDREAGALLVDVGYTHTDVSHVKNRAVVNTAVIGAGGKHITADLSYGLELSHNIAEGIKRRFVFGLDYENSVDSIRTSDGTTIYVEEDFVRSIIEARVEELGELILEYAVRTGYDPGNESLAPMYLTGGGLALMRGSREFLEKHLGITINADMPRMPRFSSPNYASAFAVADFALSMGMNTVFARDGKKRGGVLSKIFKR